MHYQVDNFKHILDRKTLELNDKKELESDIKSEYK